jgi:hypothetical protein
VNYPTDLSMYIHVKPKALKSKMSLRSCPCVCINSAHNIGPISFKICILELH